MTHPRSYSQLVSESLLELSLLRRGETRSHWVLVLGDGSTSLAVTRSPGLPHEEGTVSSHVVLWTISSSDKQDSEC